MSRYRQGEIVTVPFRLSDGDVIDHPALVVSHDLVDFGTDIFYTILISTKNHHPEYSIEITNEMLTSPMDEQSYFVTHQLDKFESDSTYIRPFYPKRYLKDEYVEDVLNKVISVIFNLE